MAVLKRLLLTITVLAGFMGFQGYDMAYGWEEFVRTGLELFAVGEVGSEKSYLYTINPLNGEINLIGDTGLNNCRGLDFNPEGKLKAFCELREAGAVATNGLDPLPGVVAELNINSGGATWAVPHGVSNSMSDIAIRDTGELFSHENVDPERLHRHVEENDFAAMFVGESGVEALDHAMAFWGSDELKMAANVDSPKLYTIDTKTGSTLLVDTLLFPGILTAAANSVSPRELRLEEIHFGSMDKINFAAGMVAQAVTTKAGAYAFNESDADFAVLMFKVDGAEVQNNGLFDGPITWAAIGLMDADTRQVDFIVEIQGEAEVTAIAVREREPNPIPTMSEWGLIITATALFALAMIFLVRRNKMAQV